MVGCKIVILCKKRHLSTKANNFIHQSFIMHPIEKNLLFSMISNPMLYYQGELKN